MFVVWLLTGFWHGASWNYVLWGLYYFVLLTAEKLLLRKPYAAVALWRKILRRCFVLVAVWFGWILFYFEDLSLFGTAVSCLLGRNGFWDVTARLTLLNNLFFLAVAVAACTPIVPILAQKIQKSGWRICQGAAGAVSVVMPVALLFLSFLSLVGNTYNPFLYFQF